MPAAPSSSQEHCDVVTCGKIAAMVARGCMGSSKTEWTVEFATGLVHKQHGDLPAAYLEKAKRIAERVINEVVRKKEEADDLEAWAAEVENKEVVFEDEEAFAIQGKESEETNLSTKTAVASKEQLQAAVKELGMGPAAYKGLPKDDAIAHREELQKRVLAYIAKNSGEQHDTLPSTEELQDLKKTIEASKELSSLDASNIIEGRPRRRAASTAAAAIKKDVERDMEREAAQAAASGSQAKKQKTADGADDGAKGEADKKKEEENSESDEDEEREENEEEGSETGSNSSDDSSGSDDSEDNDEEEEEGEEDKE